MFGYRKGVISNYYTKANRKGSIPNARVSSNNIALRLVNNICLSKRDVDFTSKQFRPTYW